TPPDRTGSTACTQGTGAEVTDREAGSDAAAPGPGRTPLGRGPSARPAGPRRGPGQGTRPRPERPPAGWRTGRERAVTGTAGRTRASGPGKPGRRLRA